ncbi:MAG: hypothetical protein IT424_09040 [Pirellulales bacterium]|nr:hypothetical protein [Pirellulales bacterium]
MAQRFITFAGYALLVVGLGNVALAAPPLPTPELDAGSIGSAITLAIGGVLVLSGRRSR